MTDQIGNGKSAIGNSEGWLRGRDLNPRPLGYEPNELPDCSTPRQDSNFEFAISKFEFLPCPHSNSQSYVFQIRIPKFEIQLVGLGRVELPTSRLSGVRSNQLSYRPLVSFAPF